jgi:hypothetical protein
VDAGALTIALPAVAANQANGLLFGATVAQVVFGIRGRWWLAVVGAGTGFTASEWLRGGSHDNVPGTLFGLIAISTLVAILLRVTLTHEGRIQRQRSDLERERELLGAVLESVDTGVLATDGDNRGHSDQPRAPGAAGSSGPARRGPAGSSDDPADRRRRGGAHVRDPADDSGVGG